MSVTSSDTANVRAEKALAAYIRGARDANGDDVTFSGAIDLLCVRAGVLNGLPIHEGRQTAPKSAPALVVEAAKGTLIADGTAWYEAPVTVSLVTHRNEDDDGTNRAEVIHWQRSKAIDDLLCEEGPLKTALNKPESPAEDERAVDEFLLMGAYMEGNEGSVEGEHIIERWDLMLICSPWDPA